MSQWIDDMEIKGNLIVDNVFQMNSLAGTGNRNVGVASNGKFMILPITGAFEPPDKTYFVSPAYSLSASPFFGSIAAAVAAIPANERYTLVVYAGDYIGNVTTTQMVDLVAIGKVNIVGNYYYTGGCIDAPEMEISGDFYGANTESADNVVTFKKAANMWLENCVVLVRNCVLGNYQALFYGGIAGTPVAKLRNSFANRIKVQGETLVMLSARSTTANGLYVVAQENVQIYASQCSFSGSDGLYNTAVAYFECTSGGNSQVDLYLADCVFYENASGGGGYTLDTLVKVVADAAGHAKIHSCQFRADQNTNATSSLEFSQLTDVMGSGTSVANLGMVGANERGDLMVVDAAWHGGWLGWWEY